MNPLTPYPITPVGNFLGFVLAVAPLPLQFQFWNIGVFMYGIWIALFNFQTFVNTIIWHDNVNITASVWCDIVTKIQFGAGTAVRGCTLAICIRLYKITRCRTSDVIRTRGNKRTTIFLDFFLTLGLPLFIMGLDIIVQPFRFDITEEFGCSFAEYSFVAYIIYYLPSVVLSAASLCFAIGTIRVFLAHRKEMNAFLSSDPSMQSGKYKRLIIIAFLDTVVNVPIMIVSICENVIAGKTSSYNHPYISWDNVHHGGGGDRLPGTSLSTILQFPASDWSSDEWNFFSTKWNEWIYVFHAVVFFAVFGTTPEMVRQYRKVFWFLPERLGFKRKNTIEESISEIRFDSGPSAARGTYVSTDRTNTGTGDCSNMPAGVHTTGVTGYHNAFSEIANEEVGDADTTGAPSLKLTAQSDSVLGLSLTGDDSEVEKGERAV